MHVVLCLRAMALRDATTSSASVAESPDLCQAAIQPEIRSRSRQYLSSSSPSSPSSLVFAAQPSSAAARGEGSWRADVRWLVAEEELLGSRDAVGEGDAPPLPARHAAHRVGADARVLHTRSSAV